MNCSSFNHKEYFEGYGVLNSDSQLVWSAQVGQECGSLSGAALVRDRDYPGMRVVYWVQSKAGSDTIHKVIPEELL